MFYNTANGVQISLERNDAAYNAGATAAFAMLRKNEKLEETLRKFLLLSKEQAREVINGKRVKFGGNETGLWHDYNDGFNDVIKKFVKSERLMNRIFITSFVVISCVILVISAATLWR